MKDLRRKKILQLALWTWSWVASLAIATFGPKFIWKAESSLTIWAIVINLVIGILMILANRNLFNLYDELERKIHLEAMGFSLGSAVVVGITFSLLDLTNLIAFDAEIGMLVGFIGISYFLALLFNTRRYS